MKPGGKYSIAVILVVLVPLGFASFMGYKRAVWHLESRAVEDLQRRFDMGRQQIESWYGHRVETATQMANAPSTVQLMSELRGNQMLSVPLTAGVSEREQTLLAKQFLQKKLDGRLYKDVYLLEPTKGQILFAAQQPVNIGQRAAKLSAGALGQPFQQVAETGQPAVGEIIENHFGDGSPVQFVCAPIRGSSAMAGVLALAIGVEPVKQIVSTIEADESAVLVGADMIRRLDGKIKLPGSKNPSSIPQTPDGKEAILKKRNACGFVMDDQQTKVYSCYAKTKIAGLDWRIIAAVDREGLLTSTDRLGRLLIWNIVFAVGCVLLVLLWQLSPNRSQAEIQITRLAGNVGQLAKISEQLGATYQRLLDDAAADTQDALAPDVSVRTLKMAQLELTQIINVINDVADGISLMALDATVEVAGGCANPGGVSGVCKEMKRLVRSADEATQTIRQQIDDLEEGRQNIVLALENVAGVVDHLGGIALAIVTSTDRRSSELNPSNIKETNDNDTTQNALPAQTSPVKPREEINKALAQLHQITDELAEIAFQIRQ